MDPEIIETEKWILNWVIGLDLCPFAKAVFDKGLIDYQICEETSFEGQLKFFINQLDRLESIAPKSISTLIIIYPIGLEDFDDYLDLYYAAEEIASQHLNAIFQLASFHPKYMFANTSFEEPSNKTNQSPYPIIQILRTNEVTRAVDSYPDIDQVPLKNINKMNALN